MVSRIGELYQREAGTLLPVAVALFAVQFLVAIILPTRLNFIATLVFWVLAILYQGFVVELVSAAESNRRTGIGELMNAVTPVLGSLLVISILFAIGVGHRVRPDHHPGPDPADDLVGRRAGGGARAPRDHRIVRALA